MRKTVQLEILSTLWFIVGVLSYEQNYTYGWVFALCMGVGRLAQSIVAVND